MGRGRVLASGAWMLCACTEFDPGYDPRQSADGGTTAASTGDVPADGSSSSSGSPGASSSGSSEGSGADGSSGSTGSSSTGEGSEGSSTSGGPTCPAPIQLLDEPAHIYDVALEDGFLWLALGAGQREYLTRVDEHGAAMASPVLLDDGAALEHPSLTVVDAQLIVAFDSAELDGVQSVYMSRYGAGDALADPVRLSADPGAQYPKVRWNGTELMTAYSLGPGRMELLVGDAFGSERRRSPVPVSSQEAPPRAVVARDGQHFVLLKTLPAPILHFDRELNYRDISATIMADGVELLDGFDDPLLLSYQHATTDLNYAFLDPVTGSFETLQRVATLYDDCTGLQATGWQGEAVAALQCAPAGEAVVRVLSIDGAGSLGLDVDVPLEGVQALEYRGFYFGDTYWILWSAEGERAGVWMQEICLE